MSMDVSDNIKKYKVSILGETYNLASDESEEHINNIVQFVDSHMRDIVSKSLVADQKRVAILVALQCASKALAAKNEVEQHQRESEKLIDLINHEIAQFRMI